MKDKKMVWNFGRLHPDHLEEYGSITQTERVSLIGIVKVLGQHGG